VPDDERAGAILRGRYVDAGTPGNPQADQITVHAEVVADRLADIFLIRSVLDAVTLVVGLDTALALIPVFAISLRLRQREIQTMFKLGWCNQGTTFNA